MLNNKNNIMSNFGYSTDAEFNFHVREQMNLAKYTLYVYDEKKKKYDSLSDNERINLSFHVNAPHQELAFMRSMVEAGMSVQNSLTLFSYIHEYLDSGRDFNKIDSALLKKEIGMNIPDGLVATGLISYGVCRDGTTLGEFQYQTAQGDAARISGYAQMMLDSWVIAKQWEYMNPAVNNSRLNKDPNKEHPLEGIELSDINGNPYFPNAGKGNFGPHTVGAAERYIPTNINIVKDNYLKKMGINAHELKEGIVGKKNIAHYDIYVDKDTGMLWIYTKGGIGYGEPTYTYIK